MPSVALGRPRGSSHLAAQQYDGCTSGPVSDIGNSKLACCLRPPHFSRTWQEGALPRRPKRPPCAKTQALDAAQGFCPPPPSSRFTGRPPVVPLSCPRLRRRRPGLPPSPRCRRWPRRRRKPMNRTPRALLGHRSCRIFRCDTRRGEGDNIRAQTTRSREGTYCTKKIENILKKVFYTMA